MVECSICKTEKPNNRFRISFMCDSCYKKKYWEERTRWATSEHFYPWNINGTMRLKRERKKNHE